MAAVPVSVLRYATSGLAFVGLLTAVSAFAGPAQDIGVDQIGAASSLAAATEQIRPKAVTSAPSEIGVDQLPETLQPKADGSEDSLGRNAGPAPTLADEVLAAWNLIRQRGQTPTPDLIAREIGPDKLAEFLASSPAAGSILTTGVEPDPKQGESRPVDTPGKV